MLEEHDLVEPNVTTARADTPQQCFKGLAEGRYDVVTLATDAYAYLKLLDESLLKMKSSGEWFSIVRRHLSEFRAANKSS